jgi:hypothetical protein
MSASSAAGRPGDRLVRLPIGSIRPTPENDLIYRPVRADDPDIRDLARSIEKLGLQEPLLVSRDGFILSGHRRYAACLLLGMRYVDCRVKDISRADPEFETMMVACNRQRVKSLDELMREQVIASSPEDAYRSLVEYRKAKSAVSGEFLSIEGTKTRKAISRAKWPMLDAVARIIEEKCEYWPLSDREIHYDLLSDPPLRHASKPGSRYKNDRRSYQDLCDLLTRARLAGLVSFAAIADPTRTVCNWRLDREPGAFIRRALDDFLKGYWRDLQQSQPNHLEIVGEKNTVEASIRDVAAEFCIPYTLGRGYCSLDPRHKMCQRFRASGKERLIVLVLADFDPEGEDIPNSFAKSMRDDFGISNIVAKKVCLTHEQVLERELPRTFDIKKEGSRYKKFAAKYGDRAHELEALPVDDRAELLREAIESVLDVDAYNREVEAEKEDAARIEAIRQKAVAAMVGVAGLAGPGPRKGGRP